MCQDFPELHIPLRNIIYVTAAAKHSGSNKNTTRNGNCQQKGQPDVEFGIINITHVIKILYEWMYNICIFMQ